MHPTEGLGGAPPRTAGGTRPAPEDVEPPHLRHRDAQWPPVPGTRIGVYIPAARDATREHDAMLVRLGPTKVTLTRPRGIDPGLVKPGLELKLLFPGEANAWGLDARLENVERRGVVSWRAVVVHGPTAIEQRTSRNSRRKVVVVRHDQRLIPAHLVSRTKDEVRFECGRGVHLRSDDRLTIEVEGDVLTGAVVSSRTIPNGIEFGVALGR